MSYASHARATSGSIAPVSRSQSRRGRPSGPSGLKTASNERSWPPSPMTSSILEKSSKNRTGRVAPAGDRPAVAVAVAEHVLARGVEVDPLEVAEIDRVGAGRPGAAEDVGVRHLEPEAAPAARRMAVEQPGPRLGDRGERRLDVGDQLLDQRPAARAVGGRVGEDVMARAAVGVEHDADQVLAEAHSAGSLASRQRHAVIAAEPGDDVERRALARLRIVLGQDHRRAVADRPAVERRQERAGDARRA